MLSPVILIVISTISSPQAPLPPPVQVLEQFYAQPDLVRRKAVETYSKGCRDRRARMRYRKQAGALSRFERIVLDPSPAVRLAAVTMAVCFGPAKSAPALSRLVGDTDPAVSLKAMNQVADFSDASTTAAMVSWLETHQTACLTASPSQAEHCIYALYATGQSARNEPAGSKLRLAGSRALQPFLGAALPKAREVAVVALSFIGSSTDVAPIKELIDRERQGSFTQANSTGILSQFQAIASQLAQSKP